MKTSHLKKAESPISDDHDIISIAKDVIQQEARALEKLIACIDDRFIKAVELLHINKGRVIVSGMGKSGHIAKKITATLASTGQPALFVHPAEANHGDLGMITSEDRLLLLSNSGESAELKPMLEYAKRFSIPIVAITQKSTSTLARYANVVLTLANVQEACPMGLAPTTSTTMALALGDALAVAILSTRGFKSHNFKTFHPGGKLGQQLAHVKQFMHTGKALAIVPEETKMHDALVEMTKKSFGCVGVINKNGQLVGIITDGDLRRHMENDILSKTAAEIMSSNPLVIEADTLMSEAVALMNGRGITGIFVVNTTDDRHPVGFIHIHDCLRAGVA